MDENKDKKIRLTVPATDGRLPDPAITRPGALQEWLDQLPNIDVEGMIARITRALGGLNRHPEAPAQFPALLQCYQKSFDETCEQFVKGRGLHQNRGAGRRSTALLNGFLEFNRELAFGYSRLLNDRADSLKRDELVNVIARAMESHERDILFSYERYRKAPPRSRLELYQLFLIAEDRGVAVEPSEAAGSSPGAIINRVLLLQLADPFSLPQQALWATHAYLARHAPLASLGQEPGSGILLDIQGGLSPRLIVGMASPSDDPRRYRYLDTRLLCEATRRHLSLAVKDTSKLPKSLEQLDQLMALQLLRQWHQNWSLPPSREIQRQERHHRVMLACGLTASHHYLTKGSLSPDGTDKESLDEEVILEGATFYQGSAGPQADFPLQEWRLFDLTEKGAGLSEEENNGSCFQVGQLALMSTRAILDEPRPWTVAVIRRRLEGGPHENEIGLEFLKGQLHPLEVKPLIMEATDPPDFAPALIIEQPDAPALLLTLRGLFKPNRAFILRKNNQSRRVRAANLDESTRYFDLFSFTVGD
ncbi:MAG: hypothetical protein KJ558_07135 [Gammaproteobacteria bacterium]|nr:hypothetical protein [Gammaproteobacteria bacterium]MBU1654590.1 hypothetical protein [Gammaproteobacteria bacterium]MBU1962318.1 hypothetical protein [Gammaproteobacteria bacterium]